MVVKCKYCDKNATRVTAMYTLRKPKGTWLRRTINGGKYMKEAVCREHYLMFQHGIETVTCGVCGKKTLLEMDDYYDMPEIYCSHCKNPVSHGGE